MGVRDFLADKWARLKAWAKSVPPDVWIGLAIGFVTLLVIWMTYKKSSSSNGVSTSTDNPIVGDSSPGSLSILPTSSSNPLSSALPDLTTLWTQNNNMSSNNLISKQPAIAMVTSNSILTTPDESVFAKLINPIVKAPVISQAPIGINGALWGDTNTEIHAASLYSPPPAPVVSQSTAPGALPGDTMAERTPAPAPITITQHYTILSSPAYAPIKAAKNDIGIY